MGHSLGGTIVLWILADPVLRRQFPEVIGAVDGVVLLAPVDLTARPDFDGSVFDRLAHVSGLEIYLADVSGALRGQAAVGARESVVDPRRATWEDADWAVEILRGRMPPSVLTLMPLALSSITAPASCRPERIDGIVSRRAPISSSGPPVIIAAQA